MMGSMATLTPELIGGEAELMLLLVSARLLLRHTDAASEQGAAVKGGTGEPLARLNELNWVTGLGPGTPPQGIAPRGLGAGAGVLQKLNLGL